MTQGESQATKSISRHLFIVSRHNPALRDYLREHFTEDTGVQVILDRRREQRRRAETSVDHDRRVADRRTRPYIDAQLRQDSHAFLTLG